MKRQIHSLTLALFLFSPRFAFANDASVTDASVTDASVTDASVTDASVTTAGASGCVSDPIAPDRAPSVTVRLEPEQPRVGDRVRVVYHFVYRREDRVEFDPDPVAFQHPAVELEYAREQPERDRTAHPAEGGKISTDVTVAVQPFRAADIVIRAQPARVSTGEEIARVCTPEVRFRVRTVFGNDPHPAPRDLARPEDVFRDALRWRYLSLGLDALFVIVTATLALSAWYRRRPTVLPPPPPPRHPYLVAREGLDALAQSDLLSRGLTKDYYDTLSDIIRRYLGGMCGFDAIEMTSDELLYAMRKHPLAGVTMAEIEQLLGECDLVKFARYVPSHDEAEAVLSLADSIVERGKPTVALSGSAP